MAERATSPPPPPPQPTLILHDPVISQSPPIFESGTYVVQVPKDQIYRVPPPENALIVERHRNPQQKKRTRYCSFFCCCFLIVATAVIAIALGIGLSFAFFKSKNPEFRVQRFIVKNNTSHHYPDYDITLKVRNPNDKSDILYMQGGVASLLYKDQKMAAGKFPTFHQDNKNSTYIGIVLKGQSIKGAKPKMHVSFSLKIGIPAKMKTSSFISGEVKIVVKCEFMVDTLAKGTRILSQQCQTNR
ncbi:conserved hypothetical protein [Ricinus communis]|uniref:Late embryogenesis abundant protein LEA-2 subgroup domain-containing protein n=2 Tax=Ricinus communis TaxID=3988 RepID=B9RJH9_RICCO|nr:conserved hypothetical protein [Ricinus communis]|eukprot:XP_002513898.1 NDR1/HIN1-like protein 13 [Ricinus communis]